MDSRHVQSQELGVACQIQVYASRSRAGKVNRVGNLELLPSAQYAERPDSTLIKGQKSKAYFIERFAYGRGLDRLIESFNASHDFPDCQPACEQRIAALT